MVELLFNGSDAARVLAFDDIDNLLRKGEFLLCDDIAVADDVDGDVVIDEAENIQVKHILRTLYLNNIFLSHLIAAGILDDCDAAVQLIQLQIVVNRHCLAGFDVVEDKAFLDASYIQHTSTSSNVRISASRTYLPYCTCLK